MCIYCGTDKYRKIYENHYGIIPTDQFGRTYDIHHIDGNHKNNNYNNLKAVTIQEHYDIHYKQKDYSACLIMSNRMNLSSTEISDLSRHLANERLENGTHHFLDKNWQSNATKKAIQNGTHNFLGGELQRKRIKNNNHPFVGENNISKKRVNDGTHHFLGGKIQTETNKKRVLNGTHNLLGNEHWKKQIENGKHSSQITRTCPHCNKTGKGSGMKTWHFNNCKFKKY